MPGIPTWLSTVLGLIFNRWGATTILLAGALTFIMLVEDKKLDTAVAQSQQMVTVTTDVVKELKMFHEEHDKQDERRTAVYQQMLRFMYLQCLNTAPDYAQRQGCFSATPRE